MTLYAGDIQVELRYVGNAAHATNDVLVWLPEQSILFAGDLIFNGGTPFALMGRSRAHERHWTEFARLGRAPSSQYMVAFAVPDQIDLVDDNLAFVQRTARAGITGMPDSRRSSWRRSWISVSSLL